MKKQSTLAIETSCDDTSIWIINFDWNTFTVEKILAYSQVQEHNQFGGVVPEIASRLHSEKIIAVLSQIWRDKIQNVDSISVTTHPGLPWSLVVWKTVASLLWEYFNKPIISVDHIVWHIFALFLERSIHEIKFPMVILTASWWHNNIYHVSEKNTDKHPSLTERGEGGDLKQQTQHRWTYQITQIWQTLDDAAWECFDKVSRMLGWPYPWWVRISQQAKLWKPNKKFELNRIRLSHDEFNFSFSGVKSQIHHLINKCRTESVIASETKWQRGNLFTDSVIASKTKLERGNPFTETEIQDIAFEFQESVVEVLAKKLIRAALKYWAKTIWLSGWVSANDRLQEYILELLQNKQRLKNQSSFICHSDPEWNEGEESIKESIEEFTKNFQPQLLTPTKKLYCTDNAAMIWVAWILK